MRERERERENVYDCERTKEVRRTRRETKRERERDCKAVKVCILIIERKNDLLICMRVRSQRVCV